MNERIHGNEGRDTAVIISVLSQTVSKSAGLPSDVPREAYQIAIR